MKNIDEVRKTVEQVSESTILAELSGKNYDFDNADQWVDSISKKICNQLKETQFYKFFVTTLILSKGDSGLTMAGSCLWNSDKDGSTVVQKEVENMVAIVNTFFTFTT